LRSSLPTCSLNCLALTTSALLTERIRSPLRSPALAAGPSTASTCTAPLTFSSFSRSAGTSETVRPSAFAGAALRGEPSTEEDGLEGLRSIRRGLGVDPAKDLTAYQRIGLIAGADALVVIRREGGIVIEVFDVSAAQFYEGTLTFAQSTSEQRARFIESRAQQAQLRWTKPKPPSTAPAPTAQKPETGPPADKKEESRAKRRWKKAWPYVVAGALLAGGVTYLIIDRRNTDEVGPPLLRFRPGEE